MKDSVKEERFNGQCEALKNTKYLSAVWHEGKITKRQKRKILEVCVWLKTTEIFVKGKTSMTASIQVNLDESNIYNKVFKEEGIEIVILGAHLYDSNKSERKRYKRAC
jgi:hypothetical protein